MEKVADRVVRSETEWKEIVEAQRVSKWTAALFCREHGIDYGQFLYHRRKFLTDSGRAMAVSRPTRRMPAARARGFIPIRVEESCGVRLRFPRGLVLESEQLPSAAWVVEVARRWTGEGMEPC